MTILIALAHKNFVFLASDSLKRDLVYRDLKWTVSKMRISGPNGLIMGGCNVDRAKFADTLIEKRDAGESFIDTANRLAPGFFAEKYTCLQQLRASERQQTVISVYGEAHDDGCTAYLHQIGDPSTWAFPFTGVNVISPQMVINVESCINKAEKLMASTNRIPLDIWAQSILTEAINHIPDFVDFPCDIALLQPGCEPITSRIEHNSVTDPKFEVPISKSELTFQPGAVKNF